MSDTARNSPAAGPDRHWDALAAVIATFVGLLALVVSGYTAYLQKQQVRAQIWPRLELMKWGSRKIVALNQGVGPARVKAVRITVDGKPVQTWAEVMKMIGHEYDFRQSQISRRVLPPGAEVDILEPAENESGRRLFADLFGPAGYRIGIIACYCSVLDDCWMAGMGRLDDIEVDSDRLISACPIAQADLFRE